jgi:hypothetical protein
MGPQNIANDTSRIYGEIGAGERIALSRLAIEKFEKTGRPLRIAIDISIWQFQIQAGQGEWRSACTHLFLTDEQVVPIQPSGLYITVFSDFYQSRYNHYSSSMDLISRHSSATRRRVIMEQCYPIY